MPEQVPTPPRSSPVSGDPAREAVDTLRGYFYQVWQSVHAWITLPDGALLFLEKAEDFDLVTGNTATVVQVFDSEQTITLRTAKVRKAIANFWTHTTRNPDRSIEFRFLTRAKIGIEMNNSLGHKVAGLKLWSGPLRNETDITNLATFIATLADIPGDLKQFLQRASPSLIAKRLLRRMHWDIESGDSAYVEAEIRRILAEFGAHDNVSFSDAVRVSDRLYREVCTVASSPGERLLTRARFLEIFEHETSVRMPNQEARMLRQAFSAMSPPIGLSSTAGEFVPTSGEIFRGPPPLPKSIAMRNELVLSLRAKLDTSGAIAFNGSSGMGKTTLAKLVIAPDANEWLWARVGNVNASAKLQQLSRRLHDEPQIRSVVLEPVRHFFKRREC